MAKPESEQGGGAGEAEPGGPRVPERGDLPAAPPIPELLTRPVDHARVRARAGGPAPSSQVANVGELGKAVAIGVDFLATAAAGGFLGWLIDYWQSWGHRGLVVGVILGFLYATYRLLRRLNALERPPSGKGGGRL